MKASELIEALNKAMAMGGDREVMMDLDANGLLYVDGVILEEEKYGLKDEAQAILIT